MRQYVAATRTKIEVQTKQLNFNNGTHDLELVLQLDGKLQIELNGIGVRMSAAEVALIRDLIK